METVFFRQLMLKRQKLAAEEKVNSAHKKLGYSAKHLQQNSTKTVSLILDLINVIDF